MTRLSGKIVIATHNLGKLAEMQKMLAPYGLECVSAGELGLEEPEEVGTTFIENALIKARFAAVESGLPALADDSGLCVQALGGRPGVYTADWAERHWYEGPEGRDWFMAMGKVEGLLCEHGPDVGRAAHFACVLALAWPDGVDAVYEGRVDGTMTWPPRGRLGFGFDPVFIPRGYDQTFAEIPPADKAKISHRADAFAKLVADQFG
ncbi:RdgB/HAM1 family non-canonical purine NTP pyrophosphatase [Novosphingobium sp. SG707]|uniref:RdgB/HAM1 family non-canonical purine NTP pyrophosphatase n=1 Tax=Novosphingobium sp. SG707 TaxID=2586996 RepID=UPI0014479A23|nr:RdgB/HAM1 family non-canonical purine NTP pyrophosphatase [Novosphingobium sp. SG707]NKI99436.1 XTP/dITP diphosphohydrolase [Novosphingobium sp. SG707]